jgi:hypothetical protein
MVETVNASEELRDILITKWDPLGIMDDERTRVWARDEYDFVIPRLIEALENGASVREIGELLAREAKKRFNDESGPDEHTKAARWIRKWYSDLDRSDKSGVRAN